LRRPSFFEAYLPFFFGGFAVFFVFFAMPGSCGFSQATAQAQSPMHLRAFIGIGASRSRVKMNRVLRREKELRCDVARLLVRVGLIEKR
jgi:hypothetical protein